MKASKNESLLTILESVRILHLKVTFQLRLIISFEYNLSLWFVYSLKEFLPQSYVKVKGIEKKVFVEHSYHVGSSELDAKVLYTKTARSLKTYGVTFFLVKVIHFLP